MSTDQFFPGLIVERVDRSGMRVNVTRWEITFVLGRAVKGYQLNVRGERVGTRQTIKGGYMVSFRKADRPSDKD